MFWSRAVAFAAVVLSSILPAVAQQNRAVGQVTATFQKANDVAPAPLDTTQFERAIDTTPIAWRIRPENPLARPMVGPLNNLRAGQIRNVARVVKKELFPAIGATGATPPDPTLAIGVNHIVATANSSIAFFDRSGTKQFQQTSTTFFSGLGAGTFQFDPKVFYDRINNRFVLIFLEQGSSAQVSKVLLAVSDDGDPNGTWYRYRIEARRTIGTQNYWLDYPGFGYTKDAYVICGNMFGFSSGFGGVQFIVIPTAPALTGAAISPTTALVSGGSVQLAETISATQTTLYGISTNTTTSLRVYALTNLTGTPTITTANVTVPAFSTPTRDAISTNSRTVDPLDGRLLNAVWRNGKLVSAHGIQNGNIRVRWYEVNTNSWPTSGTPSLSQSGEVTDAAADLFMPAININSAGAISVIYTRSSSSITGDIMMAGRATTDPAGTMGTPVRLEASAGNNYSQNRWGDYFGINVDPVNDTTFWGIGMSVASTNNWTTSIFSWNVNNVPTAPAPPTNLAATPGNTQVALTWTASSGATAYNIKRSTTNGGPYTTIGTSTTTNFTNTGLTNGTTYYYVVSATNTVGESANSSQVSATPSAPSTTQLIQNPGFENGLNFAPWVATPASIVENGATIPPRSGAWKAVVGGNGVSSSETLYQTVTIPSNVTTATLSFWIRITTEETTTSRIYDRLRVRIRRTTGQNIALLATYTNLDKNSAYVQKTFDLSAYKGQTVRISLESSEDSSLATFFAVDDFSLTTQ